ncbi:hypothetical protein N431DRAFT_465667 [Stipitochalara longipes BDJ]|nr:hypothetical protein N431DRAFT_465667 [Stipitochalara longipes BDJ]
MSTSKRSPRAQQKLPKQTSTANSPHADQSAQNLSLNLQIDAGENNYLEQFEYGLLNQPSQGPNPQTLNSYQPTIYDEDFFSIDLMNVNSAQNQTFETGGHLNYSPLQSPHKEIHPTSETYGPHFDNNFDFDSHSMYSGGNHSTQANGNFAMDLSSAIDPVLNQMGLQSGLAQRSTGQHSSSHRRGTSRNVSTKHNNNQQYDVLLQSTRRARVPPTSFGQYQFDQVHGMEMGMGMGMDNMHSTVFNPNSPTFRGYLPNVPIYPHPSNNFQPDQKTPIFSQANPHRPSVPNNTTVSRPVNLATTSLNSSSRGGRKLKISRQAPRAYTEAHFKGIRIGGHRMTHKRPGEWNQEAKANHYPFFLAYHGRAAYQPSQDSRKDYIDRSRGVKALSKSDQILLLDFIRANKYWCKHKKLPNPPNVVLVPVGQDGDESDVEYELPDPDETDGEEDELSDSGGHVSMQNMNAHGKRSRVDEEEDVEGNPPAQVGRPKKRVPAARASVNSLQTRRELQNRLDKTKISPAFPDLEAINNYLLREGLPSLLELANQHLESIARPTVRLINKISTSASPTISLTAGNLKPVASQNHNEPNIAAGIADIGAIGFDEASDAAVASQSEFSNYSPVDMTTALLGDASSSVYQTANSGKRKIIANENQYLVARVSGLATKKLRSSSAVMGEVASNKPNGPLRKAKASTKSLVVAQKSQSMREVDTEESKQLNLDISWHADFDNFVSLPNNVDDHALEDHGYQYPHSNLDTNAENMASKSRSNVAPFTFEPSTAALAAPNAFQLPAASHHQQPRLINDANRIQYSTVDDGFAGRAPSQQNYFLTGSENEIESELLNMIGEFVKDDEQEFMVDSSGKNSMVYQSYPQKN